MTNDDLKQIDKLLVKRFKAQDKKFEATEEKIIDEFVGFMEENIFPKFETMAEKSDIERLERRLDASAVTVGTHEARIKDIERIPVIAHQLKVSKKK